MAVVAATGSRFHIDDDLQIDSLVVGLLVAEDATGKDSAKDTLKEDGKELAKDGRDGVDIQVPPNEQTAEPAVRLAQLEAAVEQLRHFIGPELRPDLNAGTLRRESDV